MKPVAATHAVNVRHHLVQALKADLVGPYDESGHETLDIRPSRAYLTGFLVPQDNRAVEEEETPDEEFAAGDDVESEDANPAESSAKRRGLWPASIGMSFLLPPGDHHDTLTVRVRYADYVPVDAPPENTTETQTRRSSKKHWSRIPKNPRDLEFALDPRALSQGQVVPDSNGLRVMGMLREAEFPVDSVPPGTRAVSLFLVNNRPSAKQRGEQDQEYAFQVEFEVRSSCGFVARPNLRGEFSTDWDDTVADLQFRNVKEYGVGHAVSVESIRHPDGPHLLRTTWLPTATVKRVRTVELEDVETTMQSLARMTTDDVQGALGALPKTYRAWIAQQTTTAVGNHSRSQTRDALMNKAEHACQRIERGIALLKEQPNVLLAFQVANAAMDEAARQRSPERYADGSAPRWRLFQLAFILLNLEGLTDPDHDDRANVELIFFPTGGGKTEAYLGVVAFVLVLRRRNGEHRPDKGLGVAVLLRYTLRLLTLDQLGRAATLICALELIRRRGFRWQKSPSALKRLGTSRFSIGLWVGASATANTMSDVAKRITEYKMATSAAQSSPFPLTQCPWCQKDIARSSFQLLPDAKKPDSVVVSCADFRCDFSPAKSPAGLPVLFVDDQIYAELPSFVVATVDKFALMPWRGEVSKLFGKAHGMVARDEVMRFEGPVDGPKPSAKATPIPHLLMPPELIIQDELHLIAGPLGTMVGLYETAVEALCSYRTPDGRIHRPKIVASTATVKRANQHCAALFGRGVDQTSIFPPQGIDDAETFFSTEDVGKEGSVEDVRRMYVGVAATGRSMKNVLTRTYAALMSAAEYHYDKNRDGDQPADPYMTLAGYFNSLRELGGMRRIVEDDIRVRCRDAVKRLPLSHRPPHRWFRNRTVQTEPVELTSRESTSRIAAAKTRLGQFRTHDDGVDVVLASNMISVGVDIDRLGLMVIASQPKTTSEYIQASSRVGRDVDRPGLVVTCYNMHRPRDRSHYEHFVAYHESFYRYVEATSLTPFSGPALDRGLAGVLLAITRLANDKMIPANAVMSIDSHRDLAEKALKLIAERASRLDGGASSGSGLVAEEIIKRGRTLIDQWETIVALTRKDAGEKKYSPWDRGEHGKPLLHQLTDTEPLTPSERMFIAPTSMRDVEPSVHLWLYRYSERVENDGQ